MTPQIGLLLAPAGGLHLPGVVVVTPEAVALFARTERDSVFTG